MHTPLIPDAMAQWLRDASPYIQAHRGKVFVLAFAGEALVEAQDAQSGAGVAALVSDIALLTSLGVKLVLVPGSRPYIEAELQAAGLESHKHIGMRVTGEVELVHVKRAVAVQMLDLMARLSMGLSNTPLDGARLSVVTSNAVISRPAGVRDGVDLGWTGEVRKIEVSNLRSLLDSGHVLLQSCVCASPTGELFNLRAEDVALELAACLQADKLIFLTESPASTTLPAQMTVTEALALLESEGLSTEMALHLESACKAVRRGVARVHLVDRREHGALIQELYSRSGQGTLLTAESLEKMRRATIDDVAGILELIRPLEDEGVLVRRPREQLELEIDRYWLVELDGRSIATAALHFFVEERVAELACLVVHADYRRGGRAASLLARMEREARQRGMLTLFVLTTRTAHWFIEHGFVAARVQDLPVERQAIYNAQRNSKVFIKRLETGV
jgi:amino-acid N-acetyltransferase